MSIEPTLAQRDFVLYVSHIEHELKRVLVNLPPRLIRMQMDKNSVSFSISFEQQEEELKRLFCNCLLSHGLFYTEARVNQQVACGTSENGELFLEKLHAAMIDFDTQINALQQTKVTRPAASSSQFFSCQSSGNSQKVISKPGCI